MRTNVRYVIFDNHEEELLLEEINKVMVHMDLKSIKDFISEYPVLYELMVVLKRGLRDE